MYNFPGTYKTLARVFFNQLDDFQVELENTIITANTNITSAFRTCTTAISTANQQLISSMSTSASTFAQTVINNTDLYPCCNFYANYALESLNNAGLGLTNCANLLYASRIAVYSNFSEAMVDFNMAYNYYTNLFDGCVTVNCLSWNCLKAYLKYQVYVTPLLLCGNSVS